MVVFHCNGCGEALKKSQVDKHLLTACRSAQSVSCVDCGKDFGRQEYQNHVKCVSEQQKYGGANYVANSNSNKGEKKQEGWFEIVQSAINQNSGGPQAKNLLQKLQNYPNTPRKRAKFINFVSNSIRGFQPRIVEEVWTILEALLPKNTNQPNNNKNELAQSSNGLKRPIDTSDDESKLAKKIKNDNDKIPENNEELTHSTNPKFEWYQEIKFILEKSSDRTLSLEKLKKRIMKRYKKLKPSEEKEFNDIEKKLEKKLRRAPFIETLDNNIYRLLDEAQ